jgi:glycosyltransferase involved in cell wall biosynthesis
LRVIGDGEMLATLKKRAKSNIQFQGRVTDEVLRHSLARCRALEAMASGRPVIAYGRGGALDTVVEGTTGVFFREPSADALAEAVQRFEGMMDGFDPSAMVRHARKFDKHNFLEQMSEVIQEALAGRLRADGNASRDRC